MLIDFLVFIGGGDSRATIKFALDGSLLRTVASFAATHCDWATGDLFHSE